MKLEKRLELRRKITIFCDIPRTLEEIKKRFKISGISAGAFMSWLCGARVCRFNPKNKTYKKVSRKSEYLTVPTVYSPSPLSRRLGKWEAEAIEMRAQALAKIR